MGDGNGPAARGDEQSVLLSLMDGLIDRLQRSPLMRRAPAQCSPEEQLALFSLLESLTQARKIRAELLGLQSLRHDLLVQHWPELAQLLAPSRKGSVAAARTKPRENTAESEAPSLFDVPSDTQENSTQPVELLPVAEPPANEGSTTLVPLLSEALADSGRALNTTQMISWLEARGVHASREQITDALYRHEDRFRRRGASQWVLTGADQVAQ